MSSPGVYMDYAATTPVTREVAARMAECLTREGAFGNPGSVEPRLRRSGERARGSGARARWPRRSGAQAAEVVWTSGATEANNLAIFGIANYYRDSGRHIVTARTEHKAVLDPCRELERAGWRVTYLTPEPARHGGSGPGRRGAASRHGAGVDHARQ